MCDKIIVYDLGLWVEDAVRFARDAKEVWYHVPNKDAFKQPFKSVIGRGLEGIEAVSNFWKYVDKADMIYVPDNQCADMVEFLKAHDYPVCGVGSAEKLETDRWYGRTRQAKNGLPVQATIRVQGVFDLMTLMRDGGAKFDMPDFPKKFMVKVDNDYRGLEESFPHESWRGSEDTVYRLAAALGPLKNSVYFVCEEMLDGMEPGLDPITREGELVYPTIGGYEQKGVGIIERVYRNDSELPLAYKTVHEGMATEFKDNKTNFFYSVEIKIGEDRVPYPIDNTLRKAGPGTSAIQCELIENFTEVCYGLATGEHVDPIMKHKYAAACAFHSYEADKNWVNIRFPADLRQWIKLRMACRIDRYYYAIPGFDSLGTVVGLGNTVDEVIGLVKGRMKEVKAKRIDTGVEKLDSIRADINKGKMVGINF